MATWEHEIESTIHEESVREVNEVVDLTKTAKKFDKGKPDLSLIDASLVEAAARALSFGAEKYGRDNYKEGLDLNRVFAALLRHTFARMNGEVLDPESGLDHLDHMAANIQFLTYFTKHDKLDK